MLASWAPGMVLDLRASMLDLSLRVVCRALFGQDFRGNSQRLAAILGRLQALAVQPALLPEWAPSPLRWWRSHLRSQVDREVYAIIAAAASGAGSLLSELKFPLDPQNAMSPRELRDEVVTLFLAGHETTALSLTWALHLISTHPEIDAALFAEVDELNRRAPAHGLEFETLDLTARCYKESLRLYPPAYVIPRVCLEPVTIAGYPLCPGDEVWLWIYFLQRDARWFQDPERFDPGRFLRDGEQARHPRAYIPFGAGSRTCIGRHFATLEAVLVLARVLQRYRLEPLDPRPPRARARVTLAPERVVATRLHSRR
jgi:cytochrome P450